MKDGLGDDYLGVAWKMPNAPLLTNGLPPIPGIYLRTAAGALPPFVPALRYQLTPTGVLLEWEASAGAVLEYARTIEGPWRFNQVTKILVKGQIVQAVVDTDSSIFFRLRQP